MSSVSWYFYINRMMANCRISCRSCQGGDKAWKLRDYIASHYDNTTNLSLSRVVSVESIRINHIDVVRFIKLFF